MNSNRVLCVGLTGLAVGVLLGLAFAPRSGKATQALVRQKTREGLDQLAASGKKVGAQIQDLADRGKEIVARSKDQVTEALEAGKQAYNRAAVRA